MFPRLQKEPAGKAPDLRGLQRPASDLGVGSAPTSPPTWAQVCKFIILKLGCQGVSERTSEQTNTGLVFTNVKHGV